MEKKELNIIFEHMVKYQKDLEFFSISTNNKEMVRKLTKKHNIIISEELGEGDTVTFKFKNK